MSENVRKIRIDLEGETKKMFDAIKEKYNLELNTEVIRLIIKLAYDKEFQDKKKF